ncbi:beta-glucosidase-like [Olea europaea subsp. europaea]|uniref:Beta-glucosidase-like n=1 Tax=Olea europaea subsp. europaea TaxID=158383 RepID=A0A8S0SPH9_OLEEU|nr:beta-glucosidase-like [Olea europaea subsp. europaea]
MFIGVAGKINNGSNGCVAIDEYNLWKEDVALLKKVGFDSYRFSIAWTRLLSGIEPCVTIFHWDISQCLEDEYGGFPSPRIVFVAPIVTGDYAPVMRENVGVWLPSFKPDQVKLVKESYDFIGINYYTASYASVAPRTPGANVIVMGCLLAIVGRSVAVFQSSYKEQRNDVSNSGLLPSTWGTKDRSPALYFRAYLPPRSYALSRAPFS